VSQYKWLSTNRDSIYKVVLESQKTEHGWSKHSDVYLFLISTLTLVHVLSAYVYLIRHHSIGVYFYLVTYYFCFQCE